MVRTHSSFTDYNGFTYDDLTRLLSSMGRFKYDPLPPFKDLEGRTGVLARKEFFGGPTEEDEEFIDKYTCEIFSTQDENGSWDNNLVTTAFNIIRLLEMGSTNKEPTIVNATKWLLDYPEPILRLPGLFMFFDDPTDRFGSWKHISPNGKEDGKAFYRRRKTEAWRVSEVGFKRNLDVMPTYCDMVVLSSSAIAIEALLRCGLEKERRVIKALNSLLSLGRHECPSGPQTGMVRWCGCSLRSIPESYEPIDFNRGFPLPEKNWNIYRLTWFTEPEEILRITMNSKAQYLYEGSQISENEVLIRKSSKGMGDCTLLVQRALSYHPDYRGSNLETIAALAFNRRQNTYGEWGDTPLPKMFAFLSRLAHPLAAFSVLRSIPLLIREQGEDGLWDVTTGIQSKARALRQMKECNGTLRREEGSFAILQALKRFSFLEKLLPS